MLSNPGFTDGDGRRPAPGGLSRRAALGLLAAAILPGAAGCGYHIRPPYNGLIVDGRLDPSIRRPDPVRTVYVPIFTSVVFRREINLQLTELVIKEIETRTPFKVVAHEDNADTTLLGEIIFTDKNTVVENPFNLPRQLTANLTVSVKWIDNRPTDDEEELTRRENQQAVLVAESITFAPELGETTMLAYQRNLHQLARQIVNMMEDPW